MNIKNAVSNPSTEPTPNVSPGEVWKVSDDFLNSGVNLDDI